MQSSNLAVSIELAGSDLLSSRPRPRLQVIANDGLVQERSPRIKPSLEFRRIAIRDAGFRTFRVY